MTRVCFFCFEVYHIPHQHTDFMSLVGGALTFMHPETSTRGETLTPKENILYFKLGKIAANAILLSRNSAVCSLVRSFGGVIIYCVHQVNPFFYLHAAIYFLPCVARRDSVSGRQFEVLVQTPLKCCVLDRSLVVVEGVFCRRWRLVGGTLDIPYCHHYPWLVHCLVNNKR